MKYRDIVFIDGVSRQFKRGKEKVKNIETIVAAVEELLNHITLEMDSNLFLMRREDSP